MITLNIVTMMSFCVHVRKRLLHHKNEILTIPVKIGMLGTVLLSFLPSFRR